MEQDQCSRQHQLKAAADVAQRESFRRDAVDGLVGADVGEESVVEDVGRDEADLGQQEERQGGEDHSRAHQSQCAGEQRSGDRKAHQKPPLGRGEVGYGTEDRHEKEQQECSATGGEPPDRLAAERRPEDLIPTLGDDLVGEEGG